MSNPVALPPHNHRGFREANTTVLVVSQDTADFNSLTSLLRHTNWKLQHVLSEEEMLKLLSEQTIPIALLSCSESAGCLPRVMQTPRLRLRQPKFLVAVRFSETNQWMRHIEAGAFDIVHKPFEATELSQVFGFAWLQWKRDRERTVSQQRVSGRAAAV